MMLSAYPDSCHSVPAGPAFLYVTAFNLTGGYWHSPGPRAGAAVCTNGNGETFLFGGLTYANSSASDVNITSPRVPSYDMHIMKLVVGGDTVAALTVPSCHSPNTTACTSASLVGRTVSALPTSAPILNATGMAQLQ